MLENKWIPHEPHPKQAEFLCLPQREALYGGAAGGGKSDALLMGALQYVDVPGYSALLLRRTFPQLSLPNSLIPRAKDWLANTGASWNEQRKAFLFPSGAVLQFGHLESEKDKYNYQSAELQYIGFDELTQFTETQYRYLFSRLRRLEGAPVPLRMRGASNPGGEGHGWVRRRFMVEKADGRVFVPAKLSENPSLDREEYERSLSELDHITRAQLLSGDWDIESGGRLFQREWFPIVSEAPKDLRCVRYWDLAATEAEKGKDPDWTAGCKVGRAKDGTYYVLDIRRVQKSPAAVEALITQTASLDGKSVDVWMEQEPGSSGLITIDHYRRRVLNGYTFRGHKETGGKVERSRPVSSQAEAKNVKLVEGPWCGAFLDEIEAFPGGTHDDQVDAFTGAMNRLMDMFKSNVFVLPQGGTKEPLRIGSR